MEAILVTYFLCLYFCLSQSGLLTQELLVVAMTNSHCNDHRLICDIFLVIVFVLCICICKCISIRASQELVVVAMNIDELTCGLVQPYLLSVSVSRFKTHHQQQTDHVCQP